jgi:hypothetical protein
MKVVSGPAPMNTPPADWKNPDQHQMRQVVA